MNIKFPNDFRGQPHALPGSFQWRPKEETDVFISIVGGGFGLYGDGVNTFEIMIGDEVTGWQTAEEINELLTQI